MRADPLLLTAGEWLGIAGGVLLLLTVVGFVARWGIRFRLVGVTSFTVLLSLSCLAFAVSYAPRAMVEGAVSVPVVFDNGSDLVIAAEGGEDKAPPPGMKRPAPITSGAFSALPPSNSTPSSLPVKSMVSLSPLAALAPSARTA